MWRKALLSAWLVSVAVCGANAQSLPNEVVPPNCDCDMDLMFLVDGSSSIGSEGFDQAKEYIADFIDCYNCTNVGLIYCKCESNRSIPLCYYNNVPALVNAVEEVEFCPRSTTRVGYCIYYSQCTTQWHAGFPSVVVVLSDGQIHGTYNGRNTDDVAGYAENARNAGITVYAGAIGQSKLIDMNGLETISGSSSRVVDTTQEDPSWLASCLTIDNCGTCPALIKSIAEKRPYPWEEDSGPYSGECSFDPRQAERVCKALAAWGCREGLVPYGVAISIAIRDLWDDITKHVDELVETVAIAVQNNIDKLKDGMAKNLDELTETVREKTEEILTEFGICIENARAAINEALESLEGVIYGILENGIILICDLIDSAKELARAIVNLFHELAGEDFEEFCHLLEGLIQALEDLIKNAQLPEAIEDFLQRMLEILKGLLWVKKIASIFSDNLSDIICRFLDWILGFNYSVPYPAPLPGFEQFPTLPDITNWA